MYINNLLLIHLQMFTPLHPNRKSRLKFKDSEVEVIEGNIKQRGLGKHATVKIKGVLFDVFGCACGLPRCYCDAYLKPVVLPKSKVGVTQGKFLAWEAVREMGEANMFNSHHVMQLAEDEVGVKLTRNQCKDILKNYNKYARQWLSQKSSAKS